MLRLPESVNTQLNKSFTSFRKTFIIVVNRQIYNVF